MERGSKEFWERVGNVTEEDETGKERRLTSRVGCLGPVWEPAEGRAYYPQFKVGKVVNFTEESGNGGSRCGEKGLNSLNL